MRVALAAPEAGALLGEHATGVHRLLREGKLRLAGPDLRYGVTTDSALALLDDRVRSRSVPPQVAAFARAVVAGTLSIPGTEPDGHRVMRRGQ